MKMYCFIFQQNRTINEEFDFLEGGGRRGLQGGKGAPINIFIYFILRKGYLTQKGWPSITVPQFRKETK